LEDRRVLSTVAGLNGYGDGSDQPVSPQSGSDPIQGFVFEDRNGNELQDVGEGPLEGVKVELSGWDLESNLVELTEYTDEDGGFFFDVDFLIFFEIEFSAPNFQTVDLLGPTGENVDLFVGMYVPASIGGFVWEDMDGNGLQDDDEPGREGVPVTLTGTDGIDFPVNLAKTTDDNGEYKFEGLAPGTYTVTFTKPAGYKFTTQDADGQGIQGTRNSDADPNTGQTVPIPVQSRDEIEYVDAGLYRLASIGDFVWVDLNGNGLQDPDEPGLGGVDVELIGTDAMGNEIPRTTTTDTDGWYSFSDLPPGSYTVTFIAPPGYVFTQQDADGEGLPGGDNSDADPLTGSTPDVPLRSGDTANYVDAGLYVPSLAGTVYIDSNDNAQQDPEEWGIPGVYVRLLGTDDLDDPVDAWVRTDADGNFRFTHMRVGQYELRQVHPEEFVDGQDTVGSLGGTIPQSDVIAEIKVGLDDRGFVGAGYLFGELGLEHPSKQLLLTTDPKSLILNREPGSGVTEVNRVTRQEQTLELTVDRLDINRDGFVTPADALFVINHVNYSLSASDSYRSATQADVSGDGRITALDALMVINYLNQAEQQQAEAEHGGAEGEAWRFDDHAPYKLWQDDSNRELHPSCTTWCEQEERKDWDAWRVWNEEAGDGVVDRWQFDDRADDDPRLGEVITILARDDARYFAEPLVGRGMS
jgi:protocatechuate 3,4-dioxygenase beta subunit